jgi:plastocyanin
MRRALVALTVLALLSAFASPAPGTAASVAQTAGKCKAKHKHHRKHRHHKRRCKSAAGGGGGGGGSDSTVGGLALPGRLLVTEREVSATQLQLQLSRPSVSAGSTIVQQYNAGEDPHNLVLERGGVPVFSFPDLDPGGSARQTLTLTRGTWTLYCGILNHRDLGMQATLTVN